MTKEMEFAKCMALLRKAVRMELITEAEYTIARSEERRVGVILWMCRNYFTAHSLTFDFSFMMSAYKATYLLLASFSL